MPYSYMLQDKSEMPIITIEKRFLPTNIELISMLETLENKELANMVKNKLPAPIAYLCGFPETRHAQKPKLRLSITAEARNASNS